MTDDSQQNLPGLAFVQTVLKMLVEEQDKLVVDGRIDELGVLITVKVGEKDMGKLIGKSGQTVKAIRTLLRVVGGSSSQRVNLKVLEPGESA